MIEGIHVLNITEITQPPSWFVGVFVIILLVIAVSFVVCLKANNDVIGTIFGGITVFGIISLFGILFMTSVESTGRYRYEVTIDPSVTFSEIYEKYDVIEQRGEIWVLEEKEK